MNERLTKEWIEKVNKDFKEIAKEAQSHRWKKANSYPSMKRGQKKYAHSSKGKVARKRVIALRSRRIRHFKLNWREKRMIQRFYVQCPSGYHLDHIIPLSKGGIHSISNLQWLPKKDNLRKHAKLGFKIEGRPQCVALIDYALSVKSTSKYRRMRRIEKGDKD